MQLLLRTRACVRAKGRSYASRKVKVRANRFTGTKIQILLLVQRYKYFYQYKGTVTSCYLSAPLPLALSVIINPCS